MKKVNIDKLIEFISKEMHRAGEEAVRDFIERGFTEDEIRHSIRQQVIREVLEIMESINREGTFLIREEVFEIIKRKLEI